jgi:hypothetical protein
LRSLRKICRQTFKQKAGECGIDVGVAKKRGSSGNGKPGERVAFAT